MSRFVAVYYSHFKKYSEEFDDLQSAIRFLENGEDYGTMSAVAVVWDGRLSWVNSVYTEDTATKECKEFLIATES